jgi:uncharacterized protein (TIGR00725 family)
MKTHIGVIGAGACNADIAALAEEVGRGIAAKGGVLLCGGLGGVMEAAAKGCHEAGGITVGILPSDDPADANPYIDIAITTAMGHARNVIIAQSSDVLIAIAGEFGTLSEIAHSLKMGKKVICLQSRTNLNGTVAAGSPEEAVDAAFSLI